MLGQAKVVLTIVLGIGLVVGVAPHPVREVGIHLFIGQFLFGRVPLAGGRFAKDSAGQPTAFDRLMFHLATFTEDQAF